MARWQAGLLAVLLAGVSGRANVVLEWSGLMIDAIRTDNSAPTLSCRNLAILHTAIYDAVNSIARTHQPYRFELEAPAGASAEAAAVGAAYEVSRSLYQSLRARADELYATYVSGAQPDAALTNGLAFGAKIGRLVVESRYADGSNTEVPYIPSSAPGQWRRTPPFFRPPLTPHWRHVKPFCLPELGPFLPGPPPALDSAEYADALNEVKAIGGKRSGVRTPYQTETATFWSDFSYTAMPPGHWDLIAATIARDRKSTLEESARLFALLSLAQADSGIVCWEIKYRYNLWRPVTAIHRADEDNNPLTEAEKTWDHFLPAPQFPAYTSGHSTFSKACGQVLTHFFGTDAITFTTGCDSLPGVFRTYQSLAACVDEVGMSRIYGGIHFQFDNVHGKSSGGKVGDYISANFLLPNASLPLVRFEDYTNGTPLLRLHGRIGRPCILEVAEDSGANWSPCSTNLAIAGGVLVRGVPADASQSRQYRLREALR